MSIVGIILALSVGVPTAPALPDVSQDEYALFMDWHDGREDPRLEKDDEATKIQKIARTLGVKLAQLKAVIEKVKPVADTIAKDTEKAIIATLDTTPLKGSVLEVVVDARQSHVIAYVKWRCGDKRDADKEAAYAGWAVAASAPIARTVGVWCVNSVDTKLFSAKAAKSSLARIDRGSIDRFAEARYIRLFEEVRRGPHR